VKGMGLNMKKTVVIYKSKGGSTQKYAQWIAQETQADLIEASTFEPSQLQKYDVIIYGGGIYASNINGVKFITHNIDLIKDKKIIVFGVGTSEVSQSTIDNLRDLNFSEQNKDNIEFFYFRGFLNLSKLSFLYRIMIKIMTSILKSRKQKSEKDKETLEYLTDPTDWTDKKYIEPVLEYLKNI
jgi:menaquinone-dependent protoporphyrinogen IX oxidase